MQPRAVAIKLVVRTREDHLLRAGLPYEAERPPSYWAMKIYGDGEHGGYGRHVAADRGIAASAPRPAWR